MTADSSKASPLIIALAAAVALIVGLGGASVGTDATDIDTAAPADPVAGPWTKPTNGELSSSYGHRCVRGRCRMHTGTDISVPTGTPVVAASSGVVDGARCAADYCDRPGYFGLGGYGNLVTLTHAGGVVTRYAHLERFVVAPGQQVKAGETIGYVGSTGNSTGPHLHFEVRINGEFVDPVPFLRERGALHGGAGL